MPKLRECEAMTEPSNRDCAALQPDRRSGLPPPPATAERRTSHAQGKLEFGRMKRALRKAERRAGDGTEIGGTGATVLKFRAAPLARLVDKRRIGAEELRAADDIAMAFHAQAGALLIKPPSLEKRDATYRGYEPALIIDAVSRYKRWARHWSTRARDGDRTLEIVIAVVIDERAFHVIEADVGIRHGVAARAVIAGLRDYAARAGWTVNPVGPVLPNASGAGLSSAESRIAEIEAKYMRAAYGSESWRTYWSGESGARMQQEYRGLLATREQTKRGRA